MSVEQNKALMERMFLVAFNENKLELLYELCTPDFVCASPLISTKDGIKDGRTSLKELMLKYRTVYPDITYTIDELVAEEKMAAISFTFTGTYSGEVSGIPATGEKTKVKEICFAHFTDGKFSRIQFCPYGDTRSVLSKH
ncbi:ester cyclase [Pleurocapsales cyanobacterium LEGE 06147]|nr:ester cyclase [Pleurocapsales cyanobacterium LEGE 06147]